MVWASHSRSVSSGLSYSHPTILWGRSHTAEPALRRATLQSKTPGLEAWNGHNITAYKPANYST